MSNSADNSSARGYATLRDSIGKIAPPWGARRVMGGILWSTGLVLDALWEFVEEGVKARMPGVGTEDALPAIGDDRLIDRGPTEPASSYAVRLSGALDTWANAGGPYALLENLRAYFAPFGRPIYAVSDRSKWHWVENAVDPILMQRGDDAGLKNWRWDPVAIGAGPYKRWRGWIIIDATDGRWTQWLVGDGTIVGDGHTVGSTATINEVTSIRRIAKRYKGAHNHLVNIIVMLVSTPFGPHHGQGTGEMPNGDYDLYANRSLSAIYWQGAE